MWLATSYIDISGRCQIRPISEADFERMAIPRLPIDAITWLYQNPAPMGIGGLLRTPSNPAEADVFMLMQADASLQIDGTRMMRFLIEQAHSLAITRLYAVCDSPQSTYARFLYKLGFESSYEEWDLWREVTSDQAVPELCLQTLSEGQAASTLRHLYAESQSDAPWYLPYVSDTHLLDEFGLNSDLLFLYDKDKPIGFVGVRYSGVVAEIEVFGLLKPYDTDQRRSGLMRALLYHIATRSECREATLSLWKINKDGLQLAQAFGFHRVQTRTYLELNLAV